MTEIAQRTSVVGAPAPRPRRPLVPIPPDRVGSLIATAARAPSVHNTQPWKFQVSQYAIELHSDRGRRLRGDQGGREMLISCGAALFGLRLAIRDLGYLPVVDLLPDQSRPNVLARVAFGERAPVSDQERRLISAIPHRHTHRGPFTAEPLPNGLLAALQQDALAEGAMLALIDNQGGYQQLAMLAAAAWRRSQTDPIGRAEARRWSRPRGSTDRDGVPAQSFPADDTAAAGRLQQRDFDMGRNIGLLPAGGPAAAATAVLITAADGQADWLRAGQAMNRLLTHAASVWVFASMHSQPLEIPVIRGLVRSRLGLPGHAQMVLQLGRSDSTQPTARRPVSELVVEPRRRSAARRN